MFKRDGEGAIIGFCIVLAIIAFIIYLMVILAGIIVSVAAGIGVLYGGGTAIANYAASFKENIIDSNKNPGIMVA